MAHAAELSFHTVGDIEIGDRLAERSGRDDPVPPKLQRQASRFIFDAGEQCARMSGAELADGIQGAAMVICNDYGPNSCRTRPVSIKLPFSTVRPCSSSRKVSTDRRC